MSRFLRFLNNPELQNLLWIKQLLGTAPKQSFRTRHWDQGYRFRKKLNGSEYVSGIVDKIDRRNSAFLAEIGRGVYGHSSAR